MKLGTQTSKHPRSRLIPLVVATSIVILTLANLVIRDLTQASRGPTSESKTADVVRVIDGDTIKVNTHQGTETVRYIGIDTPETVKPGEKVQCFGREASDANRRLVMGHRVRLVTDSEPRDRYGRLLAYVWSGNVFINARLIAGGYAHARQYPPNTRYAARFSELERRAKRARRGLWRACSQ